MVTALSIWHLFRKGIDFFWGGGGGEYYMLSFLDSSHCSIYIVSIESISEDGDKIYIFTTIVR